MNTTPIKFSAIEMQLHRLNQIVRYTGIYPNILDVDKLTFDKLCIEMQGMRYYTEDYPLKASSRMIEINLVKFVVIE